MLKVNMNAGAKEWHFNLAYETTDGVLKMPKTGPDCWNDLVREKNNKKW